MLIPMSTGLVQGVGGVPGAWDITTASFVQNFSVAAQDTSPSGVTFKPDGTKMYVLGFIGQDVNEYNLSTAWDVSTASYLQNFSVSAQDAGPSALFFKSDGLKLYIVGTVQDRVYEYDLSTAWDITTTTYVQNFSVATQETLPTGLFFKPDGTKMYTIGDISNGVYEYDLSTAWDISTASHLQTFSVPSAQTFNPGDVFFKPDGTKMYVQDRGSPDGIFEYDLSTAWDVSTASYLQDFNVSPQEATQSGFFIRDDGLKLYLTGTSGDDVNEYDLGL